MVQLFHVGAPSRFVTGVAWFLIGVAAACAVLAVFGLVAEFWPLAASTLKRLDASVPLPSGLGTWLAGTVGAGLLLAGAVGLLRRLDWARRLMLALLLAGSLATALGLAWAQGLLQTSAALVGIALCAFTISKLMSSTIRCEFV
jgi:hypothetical protein